MKKRTLSTRGYLTIIAIVLVLSGALLSLFPNTENYEVRTMRVYEEVGEITYLIDGNNEVYGMYDKVYDKYADLYVTVDNKGTSTLKDDEIVRWAYRN